MDIHGQYYQNILQSHMKYDIVIEVAKIEKNLKKSLDFGISL